MKVKVVTIPFDESEGFDDDALQGRLEGRDVVSATDHFFVHGGRPWLCLVVLHSEDSTDGGRRDRNRSRDWAADLDEVWKVLARPSLGWVGCTEGVVGLSPGVGQVGMEGEVGGTR